MESRKKKDGFTIVELMVGMLALAIIALTVGAMLFYGWTAWRRNTESVEMQRNAMIAIRILEHRIHNASIAQIGGWGAGPLTFTDDPDFSSAEFSAGSYVTMNYFNAFTNAEGGVDVDFTLSTLSGTDSQTYSMTVYPRN